MVDRSERATTLFAIGELRPATWQIAGDMSATAVGHVAAACTKGAQDLRALGTTAVH
jgi:hypothetical protein